MLLVGLKSFQQKINPEKLNFLLSEGERLHSEAIVIYQEDSLISEHYFGIGRPTKKIELMSCTKSIVGLAVMCLLDDGLLDSIQTPVHVFYPQWNQGAKKDITIEHLLNMTSGLQDYPTTDIEIYPSPDFIELALKADLTENPGETFRYNNKAVNLLPGIIQKITGKRMDQYIAERIFTPLNITEFSWSLDSAGNPHGMSGCQIKPTDLAKIGILMLNEGNYNGNQIIAAEYIKKLLVPGKTNPEYGFLWWLSYRFKTEIKKEIIIELERLGASAGTLSMLSVLENHYDSNRFFFHDYKEFILIKWRRLVSILWPNSLNKIYKHVLPEERITTSSRGDEITTYFAAGWLGNYLVIDPRSKIVGVRMISYKSFRPDGKMGIGEDNFFEFNYLISDLTEGD